MLAGLGLAIESRWELDRLARATDSSPDRLLILANAFRSQGMASQAIQLARRALARGAPADARTFRLIYPMLHEEALLAEAAEQRLDPSFVAALIRQESSFNPAATSPAGARGLAQVMPELGERLARELNYPVWDPVLLYQPDVSIQLGAVPSARAARPLRPAGPHPGGLQCGHVAGGALVQAHRRRPTPRSSPSGSPSWRLATTSGSSSATRRSIARFTGRVIQRAGPRACRKPAGGRGRTGSADVSLAAEAPLFLV